MKQSIFEASEALQKSEGLILEKTRSFCWFSSNSEVEATWASLIGWPHKTSNTEPCKRCLKDALFWRHYLFYNKTFETSWKIRLHKLYHTVQKYVYILVNLHYFFFTHAVYDKWHTISCILIISRYVYILLKPNYCC